MLLSGQSPGRGWRFWPDLTKKPELQAVFMRKWLVKFPAWMLVFVPKRCFIKLLKAPSKTQARLFVTIKAPRLFPEQSLAVVV